MFGIFRKKLSKYTSVVILTYGIGIDQLTPMKLAHMISEWCPEKSSIFPNFRQHNVSAQNAAYINNFYKPLKRQTKIFKNVTN